MSPYISRKVARRSHLQRYSDRILMNESDLAAMTWIGFYINATSCERTGWPSGSSGQRIPSAALGRDGRGLHDKLPRSNKMLPDGAASNGSFGRGGTPLSRVAPLLNVTAPRLFTWLSIGLPPGPALGNTSPLEATLTKCIDPPLVAMVRPEIDISPPMSESGWGWAEADAAGASLSTKNGTFCARPASDCTVIVFGVVSPQKSKCRHGLAGQRTLLRQTGKELHPIGHANIVGCREMKRPPDVEARIGPDHQSIRLSKIN